MGENAGITQPGTKERIIAVLNKNNMKIADSHEAAEIVAAMSADKKRTGSGIKFIMLKEIGSSFIYPVENEKISSLFGV